MTPEELFDKHAGDYIRIKSYIDFGPRWDRALPYRICGVGVGYFYRCIVVENPEGDLRLGSNDATLMPSLPTDWRGSHIAIGNVDLDTITTAGRSGSKNLCCRCGNTYTNRRDHRGKCKP